MVGRQSWIRSACSSAAITILFESHIVPPNSDTPYTILHTDLRTEPLVLEMPEIDDRYYVIQLVDLYGYNAHYVGTRVTGTRAGRYLLAGPGWDGDVPDGIPDVFSFETDLVVGIGRKGLIDCGAR